MQFKQRLLCAYFADQIPIAKGIVIPKNMTE